MGGWGFRILSTSGMHGVEGLGLDGTSGLEFLRLLGLGLKPPLGTFQRSTHSQKLLFLH